jgi:hypothetical protein
MKLKQRRYFTIHVPEWVVVALLWLVAVIWIVVAVIWAS